MHAEAKVFSKTKFSMMTSELIDELESNYVSGSRQQVWLKTYGNPTLSLLTPLPFFCNYFPAGHPFFILFVHALTSLSSFLIMSCRVDHSVRSGIAHMCASNWSKFS